MGLSEVQGMVGVGVLGYLAQSPKCPKIIPSREREIIEGQGFEKG
jgi:hypothetical protein